MNLRLVLGITVSLAALAWLAQGLEFQEMAHAFSQASGWWLIPAFAVLAVSFILRTIRWRILFAAPPRPSLRNAFATLNAGYLFNNLLPAHAGELVRVYLLGRAEALPKSRVLGTVILEKAFDLAVFAGLALAAVATRPVPDFLRHGAITVLGIGLVSTAVLVLSPRLLETVARLSAPLLRILPDRLAQGIIRTLQALTEGLRGLARFRVLTGAICLTALVWASEVVLLGIATYAFGMELSAADLLFVLIVITTGLMIPASPGYLGTFEVFGVLALSFLGYPRELALACVVMLHAVQIVATCILGGVGLAILRSATGRMTTADLLQESTGA